MIGMHDPMPRPITYAERKPLCDELEEQIDTIRLQKEELAQKQKEVGLNMLIWAGRGDSQIETRRRKDSQAKAVSL